MEAGPFGRLEEEKREEQCGLPHATVSLLLTHNCSDSQLFIEPASTFNQGVFAILVEVIKIPVVICMGYLLLKLSSQQESTM